MNLEKLNNTEKEELAAKFECWLGVYTQEVINKVMSKLDEIVSNEFAMKLIDELYIRTKKETTERIDKFFGIMFYNVDHNVHIHCLTHSQSYRDVLYDMYIK